MIRVAILVSLLAFWTDGSAMAVQRLALLIGNDAYQDVAPLEKAVNDARSMGEVLGSLGFEVTVAEDLSKHDMDLEIHAFMNRISPGDTVVVFFAGHGIEVNDEPFLLPIDVSSALSREKSLAPPKAVSLTKIVENLRTRPSRLNILFIDACRDNPFTAPGARSLDGPSGLSGRRAPDGTFIMYAAGRGEEALDRLSTDDSNPNSVFTRTLIRQMQVAGQDLRTMAKAVRRQVHRLALTAQHQQTPTFSGTYLGDFHFLPPGKTMPQVRVVPFGEEQKVSAPDPIQLSTSGRMRVEPAIEALGR